MTRSNKVTQPLCRVWVYFVVIGSPHNIPSRFFAIQYRHGKAQRAQPFVLAQLVGAWWFAGCFTFNENEAAAG
ncbi:Uncharacterised protein [Enterobacter asburiae]|uniref:Uncharacterized protein n=1 Tax=Enterobacter asburiae TaxID=61645 RepID=A0A376EV22_ENTAS|nr:Uncharacterised protein [Enterobacter asburiae]